MEKAWRRLAVGALFLLLAGVTTGCAPTSPTLPPPPTPSPPPPTFTPDPRQGGRLTVRLSHDIDRLTPLRLAEDVEAGWVMDLLYDGLTRLDDQLYPRPGLAESWTVSSNGLVITFTLRPDLHWSDGVPLTAEDVTFTWDRLRAWEPRIGAQADLREYVAAVTAPTTRTVAFVLNRRLAGLLTDASFPILPEHIWGKMSPQTLLAADLLERPVFCGPFVLQERRPGEALLLEPNPHYYGPAPFLDQVALVLAPDPQVAEMALRRGDLLLAQISPAAYRSLVEVPADNSLLLVRYPAPQYTFVGFNMHPGSPFEDPLLRQAWAYALDRESLVSAVTDGEGIPLWSPILPTNWAYDPDVPHPQQDLQRARDLLAAAGWQDEDGDGVVEKEGQPLRVRLFVRADVPERVAACQRMAEQLGEVGIAVEVALSDFESVIAAKMRPPYDFEALCMQWRNLGPDPDLFYLLHSSQAWQGAEDERENLYNFVGYRSEETDHLLLAGRDTYDLAERRGIYVELQQLLAEEVPYYVLWGDPIYLAADARLTTADGPLRLATPSFFWNIERWYLAR